MRRQRHGDGGTPFRMTASGGRSRCSGDEVAHGDLAGKASAICGAEQPPGRDWRLLGAAKWRVLTIGARWKAGRRGQSASASVMCAWQTSCRPTRAERAQRLERRARPAASGRRRRARHGIRSGCATDDRDVPAARRRLAGDVADVALDAGEVAGRDDVDDARQPLLPNEPGAAARAAEVEAEPVGRPRRVDRPRGGPPGPTLRRRPRAVGEPARRDRATCGCTSPGRRGRASRDVADPGSSRLPDASRPRRRTRPMSSRARARAAASRSPRRRGRTARRRARPRGAPPTAAAAPPRSRTSRVLSQTAPEPDCLHPCPPRRRKRPFDALVGAVAADEAR